MQSVNRKTGLCWRSTNVPVGFVENRYLDLDLLTPYSPTKAAQVDLDPAIHPSMEAHSNLRAI